jgi:anaerobic selenocysteine-containing dehydrogenase
MVEKKKATCLFCSLGCSALVPVGQRAVTGLYYDKDHLVNRGSLCPRGNYILELLYDPRRLFRPTIKGQESGWQEALQFVQNKFKEFDPKTSALGISLNALTEEIHLAAKLAKALGVQLELIGEASDLEALKAARWESQAKEASTASDFSEFDTLLIVGDVLARSPVLSRKVNQVKFGARGNQVIVIDPNRTTTAWFATRHLKVAPTLEVLLLAGMLSVIAPEKIKIDLDEVAVKTGIRKNDIEAAAKALAASKSACVIAVPGENKQKNDLLVHLSKLLAETDPNHRYLVQYCAGNALGAAPYLPRSIEAKEWEALVVLGEVPAKHITNRLKFLAVASLFEDEAVRSAQAGLPASAYLESSGTVTLSGGRTESLEPVLPPPGTKSYGEMLSFWLNQDLDLAQIREEMKNIKIQAEKVNLLAELEGLKPAPAKVEIETIERKMVWARE